MKIRKENNRKLSLLFTILTMEWCQGTWVPHGVHMVHTCMTEIKEYDIRAYRHGMLALKKMHGRWVMDMRIGYGH